MKTSDDKIKIKEFIDKNIVVDRFPDMYETEDSGKHADCKVIINVSDEFYLGNFEAINRQGKANFYFPMRELSADMGINSMFGALNLLHSIYTWQPEWKVLLHCQAGKNRGPTVKAAFYFMMLGEHEPDKTNVGGRNNRLLDNCNRGRLPKLEKMEMFLIKCKIAFDNPNKFFGGIYDWVLKESEINKK